MSQYPIGSAGNDAMGLAEGVVVGAVESDGRLTHVALGRTSVTDPDVPAEFWDVLYLTDADRDRLAAALVNPRTETSR